MVKKIYNENNNNNKRLVKEGESYGWVVDSSEAWDAYEFACDYLGKDYLDDQIVSSLGTESLAESLEYIFRIHDFNDWKERNNDDGEVTSSNVWEAYDCACEYFGKDNLNDIIVGDLGTDELSDSLAYIFRMNDFRAWKNRNDDEEFEESVNVPTYKNKRSRRVIESDGNILNKLGITEKELQIVKDFCDNGNANEEIGFESPKYGMVMITDIFRDEEGDPVFNTIEQAVDYYGLENVRNFCKKVLRYTKRIKGESVNEARTNNPKFLSVYVSQEYVPGVGWEDIVVYDDTSNASLKAAKQDVADYKANGYNAKVITRKINNPNYTEPANNITFEQAVGWVKNCPYNVEELYIQYPNKNYLLKTDDIKWNPAQVCIYSDDTVRVRNCKANRTKQVYSIAELEKEVNRILGL